MLVRADASSAIGMGHAMRCLSLVQAHDGPARFLMADPPDAFRARAGDAGATVVALDADPGSDADADATLAAVRDGEWVVLDGYHFDAGFQARLVDGGARVLALDDHGHAGRYSARLVLNQNAGADPALYARRSADTTLLLGARYAMLRAEFVAADVERPPLPERARRIVVTLGGSDPDDLSSRVVDALAARPEPYELLLLVGAANPHGASLAAAVARCPHPVEVVRDARDMPRRLAGADLAVAAAGGTSWELARVGTPQIAIVLADNQRPAAAALDRDGVATSLGWHADLDLETIGDAVAALAADRARREAFSARGRALVDGRGAERVLAAMDLSARRAAA